MENKEENKSKDLGVPFLNCITNGDSFELMKQIPDKSISLIVTDPPYWHKKSPATTTKNIQLQERYLTSI